MYDTKHYNKNQNNLVTLQFKNDLNLFQMKSLNIILIEVV